MHNWIREKILWILLINQTHYQHGYLQAQTLVDTVFQLVLNISTVPITNTTINIYQEEVEGARISL